MEKRNYINAVTTKGKKPIFQQKTLSVSKNNGGETDYYDIDESWNTFQDIIEARDMNYAQGNILKVACTFNIGRHVGTTYERDLNKIIFFAERELKRILK